jgi:hypothetical protein
MSDLNNQLKEALVEALNELFNAEDEAHAEGLVTIITEIRGDTNLIMFADKYVESNVWKKLREKTSYIQTLMATTATFVQCVDDIDLAIKRFVPAFVPFTNATGIVDNETIDKAAEHSELETILKANYWLFFLMYAATNMRVVNQFLASLVPTKGGK